MSRLFLTVMLTLATSSVASAQLYQLVPGASQYTIGCLPPCLCPILLVGESVEGTFALEFVGNDGVFDIFDVVDVEFQAISFSGEVIDMTGFGTYRRDPLAFQHDLSLDLTIDSETFTLASDGLQPFDPTTTAMELSFFLSTTHYCFGNHLSLNAVSVGTPDFIRGDCNADGILDIGDPVAALAFLFVSDSPTCDVACDANDDETFDISDPVYELSHLFTSGLPPAAPYPDCGQDPTSGGLGCGTFAACP